MNIANAELIAACAVIARHAIANAEPPLKLTPSGERETVERVVEKLLTLGVYLDAGVLHMPRSAIVN